MAHNFIEQLDLVADNTGNTALSNTCFISVDGDDLNVGNDPNLPFQNISAQNQANVVVGADQVYDQFTSGGRNYISDGMAILDGGGTRGIWSLTNSDTDCRGFYIRNFLYSRGTSSGDNLNVSSTTILRDNIFENNQNFRIRSTSSVYSGIKNFYNNFFKNQDHYHFTNLGSVSLVPITDSIFFSDGVKRTVEIDNSIGNGTINEWSSNYYENVEIVTDSSQIEFLTFSYFDSTVSFIIDGTPYADLSALQLAIPTACPSAITSNSDFVGSLSNNEYQAVLSSSSLINAGKDGSNIGNVNIGLVLNESNTQSSTNITFNSGSIELTNPLLSGSVVWELQFDRVVTNPKLVLNGFTDYVNNIIKTIQIPDPTKPSKTTVGIEVADKDLVYSSINVYRTGYAIGQDAFNVYSGQDDYHEFGTQTLRVFAVKLTVNVQP